MEEQQIPKIPRFKLAYGAFRSLAAHMDRFHQHIANYTKIEQSLLEKFEPARGGSPGGEGQ